ncbi:hypothetical protein T492DRAFT_879673, partial [Pavlovales sp. CCMP2436]
IVCDLTDCRFGRAAAYSALAMFFSEFGIMHGNNPISYQGASLTQGEVTVSVMHTSNYVLDRNEGWRFAVAYAMLVIFCLVHLGLQKLGKIPEAILDNGVADVVPIKAKEPADKLIV